MNINFRTLTIVAATASLTAIAAANFAAAQEVGERSRLTDRIVAAAKPAAKPTTAPASAYGVLNGTRGNAAVAAGGYLNILLGLWYAAPEGTTTYRALDRATTAPDGTGISVFYGDSRAGLTDATVALSRSTFAQEWAEKYEKIGARVVDGVDLSESVLSLNETIEEETGMAGVLPPIPEDPNAVLLLNIVKQRTPWLGEVSSAKVRFGGKSIDGWCGEMPLAVERTPYGVVRHIKMAGNVVMSFVFLDELRAQPGEWIAENAGKARFSESVVAGPNVEISSELDLKKVEALDFLFTTQAELVFAEDGEELYVAEAKQKSRLTLDASGLDAKAVTYALELSKGIGAQPADPEFVINRPFIAVWSHIRYDGVAMTSFIARVERPAANAAK